MPTSKFPAVTDSDLKHTFNFDPSFKTVHLHSDCELRFFCEALSLIDSMRNTDLLHEFAKLLRKKNGALTCEDIILILRDGKLIASVDDDDEGLTCLLDNIFIIVKKIILDKFVTCMHASTLGCSAWEIGELYLEQINNNTESKVQPQLREKSAVWKAFAVRLQDLAKYQHKSLKIHHDFQKSNYAPDPRAKYAYGSTIFVSVFGFLYMCLKNLTYA